MPISVIEQTRPNIKDLVIPEMPPSVDIRKRFKINPQAFIDGIDPDRLDQIFDDNLLGFYYLYPEYGNILIDKLKFPESVDLFISDLDFWQQKRHKDLRSVNLIPHVGLIKLLQPELVDPLTTWQNGYMVSTIKKQVRQDFQQGKGNPPQLNFLESLFYTTILKPSTFPEEGLAQYPDWEERVRKGLNKLRGSSAEYLWEQKKLVKSLAYLKILFPDEDFTSHISSEYIEKSLEDLEETKEILQSASNPNCVESYIMNRYFALYVLQPHITARITPEGKLDIQDTIVGNQAITPPLPIIRMF